jgi:hypothetical protein
MQQPDKGQSPSEVEVTALQQTMGMLGLLLFLEDKEINEQLLYNIKNTCLQRLSAAYNLPAEDICLMVNKTIETANGNTKNENDQPTTGIIQK